jgi:hypothetical protein
VAKYYYQIGKMYIVGKEEMKVVKIERCNYEGLGETCNGCSGLLIFENDGNFKRCGWFENNLDWQPMYKRSS